MLLIFHMNYQKPLRFIYNKCNAFFCNKDVLKLKKQSSQTPLWTYYMMPKYNASKHTKPSTFIFNYIISFLPFSILLSITQIQFFYLTRFHRPFQYTPSTHNFPKKLIRCSMTSSNFSYTNTVHSSLLQSYFAVYPLFDCI